MNHSNPVKYRDELDASVCNALHAMLSSMPTDQACAEVARRLSRAAPSVHSTVPSPAVRSWKLRMLVSIAASMLFFCLLLGSQTSAWANIANDYSRSNVDVEAPATTDVGIEGLVSGPMRFLLMLHVFALLGGLLGMVLAYLLAQIALLGSLRRAAVELSCRRWERRLLGGAIALYAVGVLLGCVWAQFSWGQLWRWDPREGFALVTLALSGLWVLSMPPQSLPSAGQSVRGGAVAAVAFWMIALSYVLASSYATEIHSYGVSKVPTVVAGLLAANLAVIGGIAIAIAKSPGSHSDGPPQA